MEVISVLAETWYLFCLGNCETELNSFHCGSWAPGSLSATPNLALLEQSEPDASGSLGAIAG